MWRISNSRSIACAAHAEPLIGPRLWECHGVCEHVCHATGSLKGDHNALVRSVKSNKVGQVSQQRVPAQATSLFTMPEPRVTHGSMARSYFHRWSNRGASGDRLFICSCGMASLLESMREEARMYLRLTYRTSALLMLAVCAIPWYSPDCLRAGINKIVASRRWNLTRNVFDS